MLGSKQLLRAAAAIGVAVGAGSAAVAQASASQDIFVGVATAANGAPSVIFVFSDSATPDYAPVDAFSVELDEAGLCTADFDADWNAMQSPAKMIYGPNSPLRFGPNKDQKTIDFIKLPAYFQRETAKVLLEAQMVPSEQAAIPYFNCAGAIWSAVVSQTEAPK